MTQLDDNDIADRLRQTFTQAAEHAPRALPHPIGTRATQRTRISPLRMMAAALVAAVIIPAAFITVHTLRSQPAPPATTTVSATPTGHPPAAPDMAVRAEFGQPITVYNLTGTAAARITVDPLSRHGKAPSSPTTSASYVSAGVTIDAITGTWTTSRYQMRLDSTTRKQYTADDTIDLGNATRLPTGDLDAGHNATGQVAFAAPDADYSFVLSICPNGAHCYDLALWTNQP